MLKKHLLIHKRGKNPQQIVKTRPKRVAAVRTAELIVALANDELEWMNIEEMDITDICLPVEVQGPKELPVITVDDILSQPWCA